MHYRSFLVFNLIGGLLWAIGVTVAGYFLGDFLVNTLKIDAEKIDIILLPIIFAILLISVMPVILHIARDPEMRNGILSKVGLAKKKNPAIE